MRQSCYIFDRVAQLRILVSLPLTLFFPFRFESVLELNSFAGASLGTLKVFRSTSNLDDLFEEISSTFLFNLRLPDAPSEGTFPNFLMVLPDEVFLQAEPPVRPRKLST